MAITVTIGKEAPNESDFPKVAKSVITVRVGGKVVSEHPAAEMAEEVPASVPTLKIRVGGKVDPGQPAEISPEEFPVVQNHGEQEKKYKLIARKSLVGDILVFDHPDVDIVLAGGKVIGLAKNKTSDIVRSSQRRLFDYLFKRGIVDYHTIRGGSVYGSLEGKISGFEQYSDAGALCLLNVAKWINEEEAEYIETVKKLKDGDEERNFEPDEENSTELGEVPHADRKGSNMSDAETANLYRASWTPV